MRGRKVFLLSAVTLLTAATACGKVQTESGEPADEYAEDAELYLSITVTRRNNGVDPTDGLTTTAYAYDIASEELSEAGQFDYTAQYPLSVYSRGDNVLYYTADDGKDRDQLFCYDVESGNTYQLTDSLWAINYIIPTEKSVIAIAVSPGERNLTPYVFDKSTNEVTRVQVYEDFTVISCGLNPATGRLFLGGYLESEDRANTDAFNNYLLQEDLDFWQTESTPTDSYIFELVDDYKKAEQRLFVEEQEVPFGIVSDASDRLYLELSHRAVATSVFPATTSYVYDMGRQELADADTFSSLPLTISSYTGYGNYYYILGEGKAEQKLDYPRGIYRYEPESGELKTIYQETQGGYINNFFLCKDYGDTGLSFTEEMLYVPAQSGGQSEEQAQTPDLDETLFDQLEEICLSLPDEEGFVTCSLLPEQMLPQSVIYFTDDLHYVIIEGGISLDTQEKVEEYRSQRREAAEAAQARGANIVPMERGESGSCIMYDMQGAIQHFYFPEKLIKAGFKWFYRDESCEAVVAGIHTDSPILYYRKTGGTWEAYPIAGFDAFSQEELDGLTLTRIIVEQSAATVTVAVTGETGSMERSFEILLDTES